VGAVEWVSLVVKGGQKNLWVWELWWRMHGGEEEEEDEAKRECVRCHERGDRGQGEEK